MPNGLALALGLPGLEWLIAITIVSGMVYGFAGFGAALIFMPLASWIVPPIVAVPALQISAMVSLVTVVPRVWRMAEPRTTALLVASSLLAAPLGIYALAHTSETVLRWTVSAIVALTLLALLTGWRYRTPPGMLATAAVGAGAGAMGGATALNGPIVILFRLGGPDNAAQTRANMLVFLTLNSLLVLPLMGWQGILTPAAFWLGLVLLIPYGLGTLVGQALFAPAHERLYRRLAYGLVAASVVIGLPLWTG